MRLEIGNTNFDLPLIIAGSVLGQLVRREEITGKGKQIHLY